ncbi:hypothetical protein HaLaN_27754 [Haematococcus lacustris]|uniref:Uncharacterized protein n=1 Tax=Haematococcus lacustris TaxID=44745 RepID=A0A6A0A9A2_HAELA|nr:hypothetical protein HaLaN_27754 [Haematococcus lacustris]
MATALEVDPVAAEGLVAHGLVPAVMKELRALNRHSLTSTLSLALLLLEQPQGQAELVASGFISLCSQLVYNKGAQANWRLLCLHTLSGLA